MRTVATADEDYDDGDDEDADDDDNDDAVYEGADAGSGDGDGDCDDDDVYVDDDVMMTTMMMAMMMMTIMMTMLMMRMMMTMMTMMMTMTMMTIMLMLMVMMTTAPQAADQTISNLEECRNSLKEILVGMSASDFIGAVGLQGGEQWEGFAQAIHVLERLAQKESAPQRGTALQTALPRHEQYKHPVEVNISAYQACSSSLGR